MNKLSFAIITCATSVAFAQGAGSGAAKAPEAKKDAPKAEPAKKDAPKAEPAKGAPAEAMKKEPPKKMEMPKPPAEVAEMAKGIAGTWKCTGNLYNPMDGSSMPAKMTMVNKLDADKAWIVSTLTGLPTKMMMMATYDTNTKKWYRIITDGTGSSDTSWATQSAGKLVWDGEGRGYGMKPWKSRLTEEPVSPKEVKMMGEMSMDGKTWAKGWDAVCKK